MTRRNLIFGILLVLAATPLVWLSADQNAGDKLLRWTTSAYNKTSLLEMPAGMSRHTEARPDAVLPIT